MHEFTGATGFHHAGAVVDNDGWFLFSFIAHSVFDAEKNTRYVKYFKKKNW